MIRILLPKPVEFDRQAHCLSVRDAEPFLRGHKYQPEWVIVFVQVRDLLYEEAAGSGTGGNPISE